MKRFEILQHSLPVRSGIGTDVPCQFTFPLDPAEDINELEFTLCLRDSENGNLLERLELSLAAPVSGFEYLAEYLSHTIPAVASPESLCEAEVIVRNDSKTVWKTDIPGAPLTLVVWSGEECVCTATLPQPTVRPREWVKVPVHFLLPQRTGPLMLKCDLVRQNIATFESMGVSPLRLRLEVGKADPAEDRLAPSWPLYGMAIISHAAPESVTPWARFCVRLRIENTGSFTWQPDPGSHQWVNLVVKHRDRVIGFSALHHSVAPGRRVDVHLTVLAPEEPGEHTLEVGLVHENVDLFSNRGVASWPLHLRIEGLPRPDDKAYELMREKNAWFYQPSGGAAIGVDGKRSFPVTITRAKGSYLWDGDGCRIIDYTNAWGTALLGHAYEPVQEAIRNVLSTSVLSPLPYRLEAEVTEMLRDIIPCADSVAFGKNGSDVCTLAIRLARLNTGRTTVLYCGFHGWQDWYMESAGFEGTGVPEPPSPRLHRFRFNDIEDFQRLLEEHKSDLAAVILEPSGPSGEPPYGIGESVDPVFLGALADATRAVGAILIFDEIITGFRVPGNSIQKVTGVVPDLACFGKALANGMPLAALVGRSELFGSMARAAYGPTYKSDLYALAAARASLASYASLPVGEKVCRFGDGVKTALVKLCADHEIAASVVGPPFRFGLFFTVKDAYERATLTTLFTQELLRGGLLPYRTLFLPSYAHGEEELALTMDIVRNALSRIREALDSKDIHPFVEIPIIR